MPIEGSGAVRGHGQDAPPLPDQLPLKVVIAGFIISEWRTAFQMGFLLFWHLAELA